jgi:hypothetical protein
LIKNKRNHTFQKLESLESKTVDVVCELYKFFSGFCRGDLVIEDVSADEFSFSNERFELNFEILLVHLCKLFLDGLKLAIS